MVDAGRERIGMEQEAAEELTPLSWLCFLLFMFSY